MKTLTTQQKQSGLWKTATCMTLSLFYFAMLAYPFGVSAEGFRAERMLIAGVIFFAISIPAWIINVKRELFTTEEAQEAVAAVEARNVHKVTNIGQLAILNNWLTPKELKQILFCQESDEKKFGEVAIKRNFLTMSQVKSLLQMQEEQQVSAQARI
nr:hypothetical protein [Desulfobulbaceae bacterium]